MAVFFKILCEQHYPGTQLKLELLNRVVDYFMDNLQDTIWQNSISNKLCKEGSNHNALLIVLRLFYESEIVEGNLKSYARYIKQKERLVIDQMLILDNFLKLSEDEMIDNLCDEVWLYVESCLRKYIGRFHDFDAAAFIPMLVHKGGSKGHQTTRHFSLQNKDNRCKIKVLQRFFCFYPYPFDCQTIPFDSHHSVIFCYRNCYTKAGSQKNVAMNGK